MKLKYNFAIQKVGEKYIAVAVGDSTFYYSGMIRLNETAYYLFNLLIDGVENSAQLVRKLQERYDIDFTTATDFVETFLTSLNKPDLINYTL